MYRSLLLLGITSLCFPATVLSSQPARPSVHLVRPGANLRYRLQELLVQAIPGDVIEFTEGRFELTRQLDIATDNITVRGQGPSSTILSFKG